MASHGILARPFLGLGVVLGLVRLVKPGNLRHERVVRIWIRKQRAHRKQHCNTQRARRGGGGKASNEMVQMQPNAAGSHSQERGGRGVLL